MKKVMIIRFSALGDILMTVPVIDALARQYPDLEITFVSRPYVGSIFEMLPPNVHFKGIQLKTFAQRKTVLWIFLALKRLKPDFVFDLHHVTRTLIIGFLFRLSGVKVYSIDKERAKRKAFLRTRPLSKQKTTFERYAKVFEKAGFPLSLNPKTRFSLVSHEGVKEGIGVAPFAAHRGKMMPLEKVEALVEMISRVCPVYLFGAGEGETVILSQWESRHANTFNMAGKLENMAEELKFISGLKLMVCMDSANMHLASLAGTRVISIWGATHPYAGFLGWGQSLDDCVQLDMACRPCSIYGNKACVYGNYPCMDQISPKSIFDKLLTIWN